ncbi:TetR/AcrR family transcriptional regulator [Aegicerativicinus sediminis]|uniref:TetR/AcrR family transcriptional regulator n=1 Tax=Aegicerativicinus sediminis TaxID=2893202 RepID=UPI001E5DA26C|nr:TetR/AcrR family transcriptional regulator [Aegicerativicinus sediminis]
MKEKILQGAVDLYLNYGFKSVTMDDIANSLGMSKKTIYQHYENKSKLVEATTLYMFEKISHGIDCICNESSNPIEEIFQIKQLVMEHLKDEKSSPHYTLQKYYPKIYRNLAIKQFEVMQSCVLKNLEKGKKLGLYRESIDVEFISRIYFSGMLSIKNEELFPSKDFSRGTLTDLYLEYHLRGICTERGIKIMSEFLTKPTNN